MLLESSKQNCSSCIPACVGFFGVQVSPNFTASRIQIPDVALALGCSAAVLPALKSIVFVSRG
eukprot:4420572-Amphidinium_carterae.1